MTSPSLYETETHGDVFVIRFQNDSMLESSLIPKREAELKKMLDSAAASRIVVDLSNVEFMSSSALGLLVVLQKTAALQEKIFEICSPQPNIAEVLTITMFHKLFRIHDSLDVALAAE
jgi:anti-sigma B factor antagonist